MASYILQLYKVDYQSHIVDYFFSIKANFIQCTLFMLAYCTETMLLFLEKLTFYGIVFDY